MFQPLLEPKEGKQPRLFLLSFVSLVSLAPLYLIMYTDSTQNEDCQCARFEEIWASCSDAHERIGIGLNSVFPLPTSRICVFPQQQWKSRVLPRALSCRNGGHMSSAVVRTGVSIASQQWQTHSHAPTTAAIFVLWPLLTWCHMHNLSSGTADTDPCDPCKVRRGAQQCARMNAPECGRAQ